MTHVEFAPDESTLTIGARRYRAKTGPQPGWCHGCELKNNQGVSCIGWQVTGDRAGPRCQAEYRQDGKDIIWQLDVPANFPDLFPGSRWAQPGRRQLEL